MGGMIPLLFAVALLPARLDPPAPFPRIVQQAPSVETIAPGVEYGEYQLQTEMGPLAIHVVAIETRRGDVHLGSVLAGDSLVSRGETIGSMAQRTRAIAGINADFFDIGNTNRPVNMVVSAGALLQLPYKRYVLAVTRDGTPHIDEFTFSGEVEVGGRTLPLDAIDEMPHSDAGVSLLTPLYGRVPPRDTMTLATLQLLEGTPPLARYRITGTADNTVAQPPGYYLAAGADNNDVVDASGTDSVATITGDLAPLGLSEIASAVGGGALILRDGAWYDDYDAPYRVENARRMPCSGVAIAGDGRLYLVEVDGRQPDLSIGTTRPQFAALMRAFGATEGLLFDGGGSSTLVARRLGDRVADMTNSPSDGVERPVADGLFVYSTAPAGPPVRLIARPNVIRTVPGAGIPLRIAAVDAFYHATPSAVPVDAVVTPSTLGDVHDGVFLATHAGTGRLVLRGGGLRGDVPLEVDAAPARTRIVPGRPNVREHQTIALTVQAYDARGFPLVLPSLLPWKAGNGTIDERGVFHAANDDANVSVRVGNVVATTRVTVGEHDVALPFVDDAHFVTLPHDGPGALSKNDGCGSCVGVRFSFAANERAAYAMANVPLPDDTIGIRFDLHDDGSAARIRLSFRNEINEDVLLDATQLGENGWRNVVVRFPAGARAARLEAIYVLPAKGIELSEGNVVLRNVRAIVAGH
jgi:exopolysaccharide biosynthesis protein